MFFFFFDQILGSPAVVGTRENLSIRVSIATIGVLLMNPGWFQHKSKFNFDLFEKKKIFGFLCCILVKIIPCMYQLQLH